MLKKWRANMWRVESESNAVRKMKTENGEICVGSEYNYQGVITR